MLRQLFLVAVMLAAVDHAAPLAAGADEAAAGVNLFVATDGNDGWSGRIAAPAADGRDGPLRTPAAALRAARSLAGKAGPVTIVLRGGRHELSEPLVLTADDSGRSADKPFTWTAHAGEKPVLSGGRRLTGWKPVPGAPDRWTVELPDVRAGKWLFRDLFVNGQRQQRARTPNTGFYRIQGASPQDRPARIPFLKGEIKPEWAADGEVELIALLAWADLRMPIRAVDEAAGVATLGGDPRPSNREDHARYYIENAPDGLDQPGEWRLDRRSGVLTYWSAAGRDPNVEEVIAPVLDELLILRGDFAAQRPVRHVVVRGLTFSHTNWTLPPQGHADTQAAVATRGDLIVEGAEDCAVEDCTFAALAGYAVELGRGCRRVRIVGNEMTRLGAGGVRIGDFNRTPTPFEAHRDNAVSDNHIHDCGQVFPSAVGVIVFQSGGNRIAHNHIHHLYYTAISVGWNWGYQETPCRENVIEFNHLHDVGQGRLSDMGAVYTLGIQPGTVIRNNLIHHVESFTYGGWGLYTDEGSTGIVLENNVVHHCKSAGFHQHYGRDNVVRNNVFALNREHQLMRSRAEPHRSFEFTNNIVYFDSGKLLGSTWANDNYELDRNVYWDTRSAAATLDFAGATLAQWRGRGHDRNSLVADPLFVAPGEGDFRLQPTSPALKLGFRPIDLSRVGVRPKEKRS